jgi:hypothetical protein
MYISTKEEHIIELIDKARQGLVVRMIGIGGSMFPFLADGRDYIDLTAVDSDTKLKKNDVIFYKNHEGLYVLHRIHSSSPEGFYVIGDGNLLLEPLLKRECVYLKAVGFLRNGRYITDNTLLYKLYTRIWTALLPVRPFLLRWFRRFRKLIFMLKGKNDK